MTKPTGETDSPHRKVSVLRLQRRPLHTLPEHWLSPLIGLNLDEDKLVSIAPPSGESSADDPIARLQWALAAAGTQGHPFATWLSERLDREHAAVLARFERERQPSAIAALWRECHDQGLTAAAWWALITHPRSDDATIERAAAELHRLSLRTARERVRDRRRVVEAQTAVGKLGKRVVRLQREIEARCEAHAQDQHHWLQRLIAAQRQIMHLCQAPEVRDQGTQANSPQLQTLSAQLALAQAEIDKLRIERTELEQALLAERERQRQVAHRNADTRCVLYVGDVEQPDCPLQAWVAGERARWLRCDAADRQLPERVAQADLVVCTIDAKDEVADTQHTLDLCRQRGTPVLVLNQATATQQVALAETLINQPD